jgi:uncharacterized protein with PIN domain
MITHRFAVDKMLGRLATWLRLIGQDAIYGSQVAGRSLIRQARSEGRVLLTRDQRVARAASDLCVLVIASEDFREQLQQVVLACHVDPFAALFSRCTVCNTPVVAVLKGEVAAQVPPYVFSTQERFARCARCHRIYWAGTHSDRVREQLRTMGYREPASHA